MRVVADYLLLVLVKQIVENFLIQKSDALKVVAGAGFETDDLIDEAI